MISEFSELERLVSAAVDETMSERIRIEPKAPGQYLSGSADPNRAPMIVVGAPDFDPVTLIAKDTGKYDGLRPAVSGEKLHVSFDEARFPTWKPRKGDALVFIDRPNQPTVSVTRVDPDGFGRFVCICTPAWGE
jgi:hypothetical protein